MVTGHGTFTYSLRSAFYLLITSLFLVNLVTCDSSSQKQDTSSSPGSSARRILQFGNRQQWNSPEVKYRITYTQTVSREYSLKHGSPPDPTKRQIREAWSRITGGFQLKRAIVIGKKQDGRLTQLKMKLEYRDGSSRIQTFYMRPVADGRWGLCVPVEVKN
jgi:hypothetical protein